MSWIFDPRTTGPYCSPLIVADATSTTSASERKTLKRALSAEPPSAPDTPFHDVPPSTLTIMLSRTAGRKLFWGTSAYTVAGSTASTESGNSIRMFVLLGDLTAPQVLRSVAQFGRR